MLESKSKARILVGKIISDKMQKTMVVQVERSVKHPKYGKIIKRHTKLHVHDENKIGVMGYTVRIRECKPYSKKKSWVLEEVIR